MRLQLLQQFSARKQGLSGQALNRVEKEEK